MLKFWNIGAYYSLRHTISKYPEWELDKGIHNAWFWSTSKGVWYNWPQISSGKNDMGFKTPVIKWFESYLSNRKFVVYVDDFSQKLTF